MDLFKRFVFGQAFNRNIRAVTGEERTTERFSVLNTSRFGSRFSTASIRSVLNHLGSSSYNHGEP